MHVSNMLQLEEVYIVSAARTPQGAFRGRVLLSDALLYSSDALPVPCAASLRFS
jgi:hypothetical protein